MFSHPFAGHALGLHRCRSLPFPSPAKQTHSGKGRGEQGKGGWEGDRGNGIRKRSQNTEGGGALVANYAAGEAGQDWSQGRPPWPLCHVSIGRGGGVAGIVPKNPPPHRWAAAGPFAAMTATHPVASRSLDRTGVCCAGRSAPSQCEMATGPGFSSPNQPDQERTKAYRDSSGPKLRPDASCATIVGNWEEPSGEFRLNRLNRWRILMPVTIDRLPLPAHCRNIFPTKSVILWVSIQQSIRLATGNLL